MTALEIGQKVPDVALTDNRGATVQLGSLLGQKTVVFYFYPKDDTPGCTVEACAFRDAYQDFTDAGAEVIGVSNDDAQSHAAFKAKHKLPFRLLTDRDGAAGRAFGVKRAMLGLLAGRVTFVIDRDRVLRSRFDSAINMKEHSKSALALVQSLERESRSA